MDSGRSGGYFRKSEPRIILIGVQARSTSKRLPNKVMLPIGGKPIVEHVMDSCEEAGKYLNRNFSRYQCIIKTQMLVPGGDPLYERYNRRYTVIQSEFPEDDVLSRYAAAAERNKADYIVRITADCIFTAPYLVSRCIKAAVFDKYDYVSNVLFRTFREGMDVEVISAQLLDILNKFSKSPAEREHVTLMLTQPSRVPAGFRFCHILNDVDDSYLKTSIDTQEDYDRAVAEFDSLATKRRQALSNGGAVA